MFLFGETGCHNGTLPLKPRCCNPLISFPVISMTGHAALCTSPAILIWNIPYFLASSRGRFVIIRMPVQPNCSYSNATCTGVIWVIHSKYNQAIHIALSSWRHHHITLHIWTVANMGNFLWRRIQIQICAIWCGNHIPYPAQTVNSFRPGNINIPELVRLDFHSKRFSRL